VGLDRLSACFEGVIPSVVATAAADGTPNVSYLSHVVKVDDDHIALSNQFFAKTAANVRANPTATLLLVCPRTGDQHVLDVLWETQLDHGPVFDRIDRALKAAIAQTGMAAVMRLRAVDVFKVEKIADVPVALLRDEDTGRREGPSLRQLSGAGARLAKQTTADALFGALMRGACELTACSHSIVLLREPARAALVVVASTGYPERATGAETAAGDGLIAEAAAASATLKINDLSRMQRMGRAVIGPGADEDDERTIALPRLSGALSQLAVPLASQGRVLGILFLESEQRLMFDDEAAAAVEALAAQAAAALAQLDSLPDEPVAESPSPRPAPSGRPIKVRVDRFDDSVFIDNRYVIKGVAGRLLVYLLEKALAEGRTTFTNREIRRAPELRLPDFKDNLESRLLLLARRLEDKAFPVQLLRRGRGVMDLRIDGSPVVETMP
jgi:adenylate cyclase